MKTFNDKFQTLNVNNFLIKSLFLIMLCLRIIQEIMTFKDKHKLLMEFRTAIKKKISGILYMGEERHFNL